MEKPNGAAVKTYWESNPLGSLESPHIPGSLEFFRWHDDIRHRDEGYFAQHLYEFDKHAGERILDIGCGIGWIVCNFAKHGGLVTGVDITQKAVDLTQKRLDLFGLPKADLRVANAEELPFEDGTFDYVTSSGVLHHTPDTAKAINEALRVTKPNGGGMISLYYKSPMLSKWMWPATRIAVNTMFGKIPGREGFANVRTPEELVRLYDGNENPIGKSYSHADIRRLFQGVILEAVEVHYFPFRFAGPLFGSPIVRRVVDRMLGLMIYVRYTKGPVG